MGLPGPRFFVVTGGSVLAGEKKRIKKINLMKLANFDYQFFIPYLEGPC